MLNFLCCIDSNWTFWTKSKLFPRPIKVGFMAENGKCVLLL